MKSTHGRTCATTWKLREDKVLRQGETDATNRAHKTAQQVLCTKCLLMQSRNSIIKETMNQGLLPYHSIQKVNKPKTKAKI